jgi:ABC-type antimicrobial peptide transport system permease subunit
MTRKDNNNQQQVKLPLKVAMEVVLQGIRIRLGRSIVTITGVICGIAFLMSILTGQMIKKGVNNEDAMREEVQRISNFVKAEVGFLKNKTISLIVVGNLSEIEFRALKSFEHDGVNEIQIVNESKLNSSLESITKVSNQEFGGGKSIAVFMMGDGKIPDRDWNKLLSKDNKKVLATTISDVKIPDIPENQLVMLSRSWSKEELAKKIKQAKQEKFRSIWIGVISLLVTVIGITNAMLMSVTERFREIGTMKCLGALSSFIRHIFLIESSLMGIVGGLAGVIVGALFSILAYSISYGFGLVFSSVDFLLICGFGFASLAVGILLSIMAALYPARVASNMVPADALRSNL